MRQEPTKEQMRIAAMENLDKIAIVAKEGYAKVGKGFVWLQFMFIDDWQLRIEFMALGQVRKLGMRRDTMEKIENIARTCDWNTEAAMIMFKGDHLESMGVMPLAAGDH